MTELAQGEPIWKNLKNDNQSILYKQQQQTWLKHFYFDSQKVVHRYLDFHFAIFSSPEQNNLDKSVYWLQFTVEISVIYVLENRRFRSCSNPSHKKSTDNGAFSH